MLVSRINPSKQENVPTWFSHLFTIKSPAASTEINDGWNISGNLVVVTNPGFAYSQLWNNAVSGFWVAMAVFILALVFVWGLVKHVITVPINAVVKQSQAITQKQFAPIEDIPSTPELKSFVVAINYMSGKLQKIFQQLSEQSEKYRVIAYTDPLTQVGNRRAFDLAFEQTLRNDAENPSGHLVIVRASSLSEVHHELGGEIGDAYLQSVCNTARQVAGTHFNHFTLYRLSGADFALLLENSSDNIKNMAKELSVAYKRIEKSEHSQGMAHMGIAEYVLGANSKDILEKADSALAVAQTKEQRWELATSKMVSHSNETWREKIKEILQKGTSDFAAQPILNAKQELVYAEYFARLPNNSSSASVPMAQLIPASIRLDYAQDLDKLIVSNLIEHLSHAQNDVGLNISRLSLFDADFMNWFSAQLHNVGPLSTKIVLEIPERALVQDIDTLSKRVDGLRSLGVKIAVEHFGAQLAGITHIRKLHPDYLKLDGRFTRNIHTELDNQLFIQSLISIAQGLNIKVIAEMVETESEMNWLLAAGIDCIQGYYVGAPANVGQ